MKRILKIQSINILICLSKNKGYKSINRVSKEVLINQTYSTIKLKQFEERGLIYFEQSLKDKRVKIPRLTEKGVEISKLLSKIRGILE